MSKEKTPLSDAAERIEHDNPAEDAALRQAAAADTENPPAEPASEEQKRADERLAAAEAERDEIKDRYLRLAAEYDNFRKRSAKERDMVFSDAKAEAVCAMLPVYDNLERALSQPTQDTGYYKGIEMIMQQLNDILHKLGVTEIEALGKPFDPEVHFAVSMVEGNGKEEGTVCEVLQKGFRLGDRVLRHAMVTVAKA